MIRDVKRYFDMEKEFRNADFLETNSYRQICDDVVSTIRNGHLVALTGIVGCGKTVTVRKIRMVFKQEYVGLKQFIIQSIKSVRSWDTIYSTVGRKQAATINMIPEYWRDLWAQSEYRELHYGHRYTKAEVKFSPVNSSGGTVYRQIPALSSIDKCHYDNCFVVDGIPAGKAFLLPKTNGVEGHCTANVKYR